jgi:hypothetical protein
VGQSFGHLVEGGRDSFLSDVCVLLDKGREPLDEGKRLAAVAIGDDAAEWVDGALVEAEVGPGDEPAELDEDPGGLVAEDTEYVGDADLEAETGGNEQVRPTVWWCGGDNRRT